MRKLFFVVSFAIALVACGDDKGSSPNELPDEVADMDELEEYKCDDSVSGAVVYVKDKLKNYECDGDHWFESYNQSKSSSSKKKLSSSSIVSSPVEGTLTDTRDGQTYKTVRIGDQVWMAENLNYETDSSFCYNDSVKYCEKYGRLYRWAAAVGKSESECGYGYTCSLPSGNIQGVCPNGWHLPSNDDWNTLFAIVGDSSVAGTMLKSTSGWFNWYKIGNGKDPFGFSALPAGRRNCYGYGEFEGYFAYFWSSTEGNGYGYDAYYMSLSYHDDKARLDGCRKNGGHSVRCLKD